MTHQEILKTVPWRDLRKASRGETAIELGLTLPWLALALGLAWCGLYWLALPFSGFFFLTGLRQSHNGFHNALGVGKRFTWFVLYFNSLLMMVSIHAVKFNHLRHHSFCLADEDYEGKAAAMSWYGAILYGPVHTFLIHRVALRAGGRSLRRAVVFELGSIAVCVAFVLFFQIHFLMYHMAVMIFGEFLMAFFAVWMVHQDTHDRPVFARTQRARWKNALTYNMFFHLEHHLFPAVPTIKLPEVARRLDLALPALEKRITF